jgi:AraC family transcriptional regulator
MRSGHVERTFERVAARVYFQSRGAAMLERFAGTTTQRLPGARMQDLAHDRLRDIPERYAAATGAHPIFLLEGASGLFAAKWRLPPYRVPNFWAPNHVLAYRSSGIATITRSYGGVRLRKAPAIGSVTFSPGDRPTEWSSDAPVETILLYVSADALQRFAEQHLDGAAAPQIADFFGIGDAWLASYFHLLESECALYDELQRSDPRRPADSLFLDHTEHLLLRHLARHHSDATHAAVRALGSNVRIAPLRRAVTRRIEEYIETSMSADLSLHALAELTHMSVDHFVRAFRAATGKTPHRFVLDRRLDRAASMLRDGPAPIAEIARTCGFRNAAHFSVKFRARFSVTPTQYRHSA